MSEITTIYLREKAKPLLKFKAIPNAKNLAGLPKDEADGAFESIFAQNPKVMESYGCQIIELYTSESRFLNFLPFSEDPIVLTPDMLQQIIEAYKAHLHETMQTIEELKRDILIAERRIVACSPKLYDKIDEQIKSYNSSLDYWNKEIEDINYYMNKFLFIASIMNNEDNARLYEFVYIKG